MGISRKISYWNLEENQLKQYNKLNQKLAQIKRHLKIETKNISSFRRRKKSAADKRPSARFTGYFGGFVMTLMFGGILLLDLPVIFRQIQTLSRYIRRTCFKHLWCWYVTMYGRIAFLVHIFMPWICLYHLSP